MQAVPKSLPEFGRGSPCCLEMERNLGGVVVYCELFDEFGLPVSGKRWDYVAIDICPWCGVPLPSGFLNYKRRHPEFFVGSKAKIAPHLQHLLPMRRPI